MALLRGRERELEGRSLLAVEATLLPWTVTWVDQRDDVGRDGFAQVFETRDDGVSIASPITCALQVKGTAAAFEGDFIERLQVEHLHLWTAEGSSPVAVVVWSEASGEIRARTAQSLKEELDASKPEWPTQQTVSVRFRPEDGAGTPAELRSRLARQLAHAADELGGRTRFHARRRRGLLLDLIAGTVNTSQTLSAKGSLDEQIIEIGPGWRPGEIDPADVFAPRVLSAALLLYEEVWLPLDALRSVLRIITPVQLAGLLRDGRLIPFVTETVVGFGYIKGEPRGTVISFARVTPTFEESLTRQIDDITGGKEAAQVREVLRRRLVVVSSAIADRLVDETKEDLGRPSMRSLIGLSPEAVDGTEPYWDARLVNRLVHLNLAMAVAEAQAVDVVEYEAGLSRLASEKWYSRLHFNHAFPSSDALDQVLRSTGVPDLGALEMTLGMGGVLAVSDSSAGQDFRDWFWEEAATLVGSGARTDRILAEFARASGSSPAALKVPTELKFRFVQNVGGQYILGSVGRGSSMGYSARSERGKLTLARQAEHQRALRLHTIATTIGKVEAYSPCPCGSGARFRFCCGPRRS